MLGFVVVVNIVFLLSENLCVVFLLEISMLENVGWILGFGWSFGYFGGLLSFVLVLVVIKSGEGWVLWMFVMMGVFFLLVSLLMLLLLWEWVVVRLLVKGENYLKVGWWVNLVLFKELL